MEVLIIKLIFVIMMIIGIIGVILPVLPGLPLVYAVLLFAKILGYSQLSWWWVLVFGLITAFGILMDYLIPVSVTKRLGGSKYGLIGLTIGFVIGIIFSPFGFFSIIIAPFLGSIIGELIYDRKNYKRAIKSASGSVVGYFLSIFYSLIFSFIILAVFLFKDIL